MQRANSLEKTLIWETEGTRKEVTEDEMVGWHHWGSEHEWGGQKDVFAF